MRTIRFKDNELSKAEEKRNELERKGYKTKLCYSIGVITGRVSNIVLSYEKRS